MGRTRSRALSFGGLNFTLPCWDSENSSKKGKRGGAALFISAWGSWVGGTFSVIGVMFLTPVLADLAVKLGPAEMFAILLLASLGSGSFFDTMRELGIDAEWEQWYGMSAPKNILAPITAKLRDIMK
jgi:uncharacterized membrane protein YdcZ (DUF606 family)